VREQGLLPAAAREGTTLTENWTGPTDKISWINLGPTVGKLMEDAGVPGAKAFFTTWYDLLYRGESINSIHAGVGTLKRHLTRSSERVGTTVVGQVVDV